MEDDLKIICIKGKRKKKCTLPKPHERKKIKKI